MKRFVSCFIVTLFVLMIITTSVSSQNNPLKIAVINPQEVLQNSIEGKKALKQLNDLKQRKSDKLEQMRKELTTMQEKLNSQGITMSEDARIQLQNQIDSQKASIQQEYKEAQRSIQYESRKILGKIQDELKPIIQKLRKERGYSIIFDVTTAGIIDMDESIDITEEVIKRYNQTKIGK